MRMQRLGSILIYQGVSINNSFWPDKIPGAWCLFSNKAEQDQPIVRL